MKQHLIILTNCIHILNICQCGCGQSTNNRFARGHNPKGRAFCGKHHSDEAKQKMSQSKKGRYTGTDSWNYGRRMSEETRRKLSESRTGKYCGEKHPMYGRHHSDESKKKISVAKQKGDDIRYSGLHARLRKILPIPKTCQMCQQETKRLNLANLTGIYNIDLSNWAYLCYSCHAIYDGWGNNFTGSGEKQ